MAEAIRDLSKRSHGGDDNPWLKSAIDAVARENNEVSFPKFKEEPS